MAGTATVRFRVDYVGATGDSDTYGQLSRPYSIALTSGLKYERTYSISNSATAVKIFDETDFADPALVVVSWSDGPVELAWGEDAAASNADTSSFVSNDAVGGFHVFWGSGMNSHEGEAVSDRNSIDGGGSDVGIQEIWINQTSGAAITVQVLAFK